jgi:hypothetical protein
MVQAILAGRKTQTRRVIKIEDAPENWELSVTGKYIFRTEPGDVKLPRYAAGDILWVRETWGKDENGEYVYRANYGTTEDDSFPPSMFKWKPSIHMPREAARIFLRVKNVGVERLQDITEEEAIKEGAKAYGPNNCSGTSARIAFAEIWDKTTTEHEWRTNPWVWVIEFEKISKE